jgi:putative hydrolase of the HAD superfamily
MSEYLEATVFYEPRSFSEEEYIELMKAQSVPLPDNALAVLGEVSTSCNWLVGLLNNESRLLHEYRMDKYGIEDYLDIQLSSCYVGLRKPDADIYRRAIDILGRPADRILFIDDRANNTEAARAAGLQAIQFQGEEKLRQDLKAIGIL